MPDEHPGQGVERPRLVVDQTGLGAYATIGEAIRASVVPGTLITVKPGIYREALVIDRMVEIVGEGDRAQVVVEATDATAVTVTADRATVRNLTVRAVGTKEKLNAVWVQRGRVVIEGCDLTSAIGAVVSITGKDSAPVVRDCEIRDGKSAGVWVHEQGQGTIEKCVISGNAYAGVEIKTGGNPTVRDCEIRDGKSAGVWVHEQGQGTIEQCVISGNASAGVAISEGGNPVVRDCEIRDRKSGGVYVYEQGQGTIEQCVISGNANAGVLIMTGGNPTVRDCEIRDGKQDGVWVQDQGQGTIERCVTSGNAYVGVRISKGGNPTVRDCEILDGHGPGVPVFNARALHPFALEARHGRELDGEDLKDANLDGATLAGASLTGATLAGASLVGADLTGANLTGANLTGANLTGADLTKADLRNAILSGANVSGALFIEADLRGVTVASTNLTDADFEDAKVDGSWLWHDWRVEGGLAHQKSDDERDGGCPFCGRIDQNDRDHCPHFVASLYCDTTYQPVKAEDLGWPNFPPTFTPDDLSDTLVQQHLGDLSSLLCNYSKTDNAGWITVDDYQLSRDIYALVTPPLVSVMRTGHLDQWEMLYCPDHEDLGELHDILSRLTEGLAAVLEESPEFALAVEEA